MITETTAADASSRFAAAERLSLSVLLGTSRVRFILACALLLWVALSPSFLSRDVLARVGVLLLGTTLAFVHHRQDVRERLTGLLPAGIARHLSSTGVRRRRLDLPGAMEGAGAILVMSLVMGPFQLPLDPAVVWGPAIARSFGLVLVALFTSFMWVNMVLVPTWTLPDPARRLPPKRVHAAERLTLPAALSAALTLWVIWGAGAGNEVDGPAAGIAVLLPLWVYGAIYLYDTAALSAAKVAGEAMDRQRQDSARFIHALNPGLKNLIMALEEKPEPLLGEALRDARDLRSMLVTVKEDLLLGMGRKSSSRAADLIRSVSTAIPPLSSGNVALKVTAATSDVAFDGTDWDIARFVLTDLLANAAMAGTKVCVDARRQGTKAGSSITISVTDNGPGFDSAGTLSNPRSSLHALKQVLAREEGDGTLTITSGTAGTTVTAAWHSIHPTDQKQE